MVGALFVGDVAHSVLPCTKFVTHHVGAVIGRPRYHFNILLFHFLLCHLLDFINCVKVIYVLGKAYI